ncbi:hypothetical protein Tco_0286785 [Tanacetum coccineum]
MILAACTTGTSGDDAHDWNALGHLYSRYGQGLHGFGLTVVTSFGSIKSTGDIMNITEVLDVDASLLDAYDWGICCDGSSIGSSRLMLLVRVYAANTSLLLPDFINAAAYYF